MAPYEPDEIRPPNPKAKRARLSATIAGQRTMFDVCWVEELPGPSYKAWWCVQSGRGLLKTMSWRSALVKNHDLEELVYLR